MKGKRYGVEEIIAIVKEGEQGVLSTDELCRKHGVAKSTYYQWKAKYSGMEPSEAQRLKGLEDENRRLKQLVAEQALDIQMLKHVNEKKW